ncbi:MAG TPA: DUF4197 domain-containing protein [Candidatus Polarisedimenticolaceae bacterium]|nr:DUF4197 domain-containing protein [Candidatus Polarisedimenticolaceae bacterium]
MATKWGSVVAVLALFTAVRAASVASLSNSDAVGGLRDALTQGAKAAVGKLGVVDGFFRNPRVKIPLPPPLAKVKKALKAIGMKRQADDLVLAMNRAAEAAVPEAKALLSDAVKKMTIADAKSILTGSDTAATEYFRKTTAAQLTEKFLPIVRQATGKVGLAEKYNTVAGKAAQLGLVDPKDAGVEEYVTRKALDGLYLMIAEEEKAIRKDPLGAATSLAQKVFGAIRR